jgi:hypothetical protein
VGLSKGTVIIDNRDKEQAIDIAIHLGVIPKNPQLLRQNDLPTNIKRDEVGIAIISGQTVIYSEPGFYTKSDPTDKLSTFSKNHKILFWLAVSAIDGLWYSIHENGRLKRMWVKIEDEIQIDEGNSTVDITIENEVDLMKLAELITGVQSDDMFEHPFDVYASAL